MDLPSPGSSLVPAHHTAPITPEGKGCSGVSGETQTEFADFSENAVGMVLIPGSKGKTREAVLDMEWKSCSAERRKGIGNFLVEAAGCLNQPLRQPKLPLLDPTH